MSPGDLLGALEEVFRSGEPVERFAALRLIRRVPWSDELEPYVRGLLLLIPDAVCAAVEAPNLPTSPSFRLSLQALLWSKHIQPTHG
jgi:hypothetical protein